ncbi:MAG: ATP-dependent helicase, partial [Planctomycetaceae bacterium]|nr:ATP-dependent helicase [Planctomycetaceae bacterium]
SSRFVKLENGQYLALTRSLKKELDVITTYAQPEKGSSGSVKLHPLAMIPMAKTFVGEEFSDSRHWIDQFTENHERSYKIPKSSRVELRDYQVDGYQWMMRLANSEAGGLLADDMGLGKTVQTIVMLLARQKEGPTLIVVPASLSFNWAEEISRFAPSLNPQLLHNENREGQMKKLKSGDVL